MEDLAQRVNAQPRGPGTRSGGAPDVGVVGGGWAGLAAAVELADAGARVTVYEAARTLGGRARRVETRGLALDNGLHILIGAYREALRLIDKVRPEGAASGLLRMPLDLQVEPDFRLRAPRLPAPLNLAVALLTARGLALRDRHAALRFVHAQRVRRFRCEPELTVTALLARHAQTDTLTRRLWAPLCVSALNTLPEEASAAHFLAVLRDTFAGSRDASDLLLPTVDFSALFPERARAYVEARGGRVRLGDDVIAVRAVAGGIELETSGRARHDRVILATGPHQLERIAGGLAPMKPVLACVGAFQYRPIHSVFLQYPAQVSLPAPMIGFSSGFAQWVFDRGRLCGQHGLLGVVISASGDHQLLPQADLAQRVHAQLRERFALPPPLWHQVIAEKRATFACTPGLARPGNATPVAGLYLAGDYTESEYPATLESAIRSGVRCASLIMERND